MVVTAESSNIQKFYDGKSVFITGCTGFLGKVLLEKLLRSCAGVENIYVLVRKKKGMDMYSRIEEICGGPIFDKLNQQQPKFREKIVGIKGDVSLEGLGIDPADRNTLTEKVSIIFHVAASVRFDEVFNTAVAINIRGIKEVIDLARNCKKLESVMHVSTAFSHCPRKRIEEKFYPAPADPQKLINIANNTPEIDLPEVTKSLLSVWPNTYTLTKAVSEEVVRLNGTGLPICIFRPAVVTAASDEPIPGWIDNINGPSGVIAGAGCGLLRVSRGDANCIAEMVPVDLVVNLMIAISYKTAKTGVSNEIPIYNHVSSPENPIRWKDQIHYCVTHGADMPSEKSIWCYSYTLVKNYYLFLLATLILHFVPAVLFDSFAVLTGRKPQLLKVYKKVTKLTDVLAFFASREWEFTNYNTRKLWNELSVKDKEVFSFDITKVDWEKYHIDQIAGIRKFVLKEDPSTLPAARRKYYRLQVLHRTLKSVFLVLLVYFMYNILRKFF